MTHVAIMQVSGQECAKYQKFESEALALAHVAEHSGSFPDAFVAPTPAFPMARWVCDPIGQTITDRGAETDNEVALKNPLKRWQFHAMLELLGRAQAVQDAIDAIENPTHRAVAKAKLAHTDNFDRDDPLFDQLKDGVGLTDAEIDAAWMTAKDLT